MNGDIRDRMRVALLSGMALVLVAVPVGCSVAGTWRTVSVTPSDAPFVIRYLTLDDRDRFTATERAVGGAEGSGAGVQDGAGNSVTGRYRFTGFRLVLVSQDGVTREYAVRLRPGGEMVLKPAKGAGEYRAVLRREADGQ